MAPGDRDRPRRSPLGAATPLVGVVVLIAVAVAIIALVFGVWLGD